MGAPRDDKGVAGTLPDADTVAWIEGLQPPCDPDVQTRLHELLLRAARAEVSRRAGRLRVSGPELDDLAHQAAHDAMLAILRKLDTFRGESRFTTWAYKFVIFEVSGKVTRHFWARAAEPIDVEALDRLPDRFGFTPEQAAQSADLLEAVRRAVQEELSERQREVFVAVLLDGVPAEVLAERLDTNRNALYKTMFDARRKIRAFLVAHGYVDASEGR
ncbi:MAG TPA: sigma-70 family RNA polymerase sigma factor [Jatrophihabitans sp.]|nr:sigma-70 family RNA polymerase sigma factor [Jatrophihabitans sp.]